MNHYKIHYMELAVNTLQYWLPARRHHPSRSSGFAPTQGAVSQYGVHPVRRR